VEYAASSAVGVVFTFEECCFIFQEVLLWCFYYFFIIFKIIFWGASLDIALHFEPRAWAYPLGLKISVEIAMKCLFSMQWIRLSN